MIKSLSKRVIIVAISSIIINVTSMLTMPIFTRIMSVSDYGVYSLFLSWANILTIVLGLQTYGTINNGKVVFETEYNTYCINILTLSLLFFAFGGIFLYCTNDLVGEILGIPKGIVGLLVLYACGNYCITFITSFFAVEMKPQHNLWISLLLTLITISISLLLIMFNIIPGYMGRIVGQTIPYVVAIVGVILFFFRLDRFAFKFEHCKYCLNLSIPLVFHGLSGLILDQSDRIMLGNYHGNGVVGIYSLAYTIALPISVIYGALNTAWTPQYYLLMSEKKNEEIYRYYKRQMFLMVGMTIAFILFSPEILKILAAKEYWDGIPVVPLIVLAYFFNFLYLFPVNYEFFRGRTNYIALSSLISAFLNVIMNAYFIPSFGMLGAAVATNISFFMIFLMNDVVAKKIIKGFNVKWRFYAKGIMSVILSLILCYAYIDDWIVRWIIGGMIIFMLGIKIIKQKSLI